MPNTIFFSWQIDTDPKTGRNLIERALERAVGSIGDDTSVDEAVRDLAVDRDTRGVAGTPPIVETIFRKIDAAAAFVPDLTFVGKRSGGQPTPNPNVLIEYGWALKALGHSRIVPVMNTFHGDPTPNDMPFDMRHLRNPIQYNCAPDADEATVKRVKSDLAKEVEAAIRAVLESDEYRLSVSEHRHADPFVEREPGGGSFGRFGPRRVAIGIRDGSNIEVQLSSDPVMWLRVMPATDPGREWAVTDLRMLATTQGSFLLPLTTRWTGYDHLRRPDGFGVYAIVRDNLIDTPAVVIAFTSGEIWSLDASLLSELSERKQIPNVQNFYSAALKGYGDFLGKLGVSPPYRWIAGMEDLKGRGVIDPSSPMRGPMGPCTDTVIVRQGHYSPGDSPEEALRPFFVRIFDACGVVYPSVTDRT